MKQKRLALFAMNIFGDSASTGIPVLNDLFTRLADNYEITFYSFQKVSRQSVPAGIKVRHPISVRLPGRLQYLIVLIRFCIDYLFKRYDLLLAVSAYPTGLWAVRSGGLTGCPVAVQFIALEAVALPDINEGNLTKPWLKKITSHVSHRADYLITVSDYQQAIAQHSLGVNRDWLTLPLRINPSRFHFKKKAIQAPVQFIQVAYNSPVKDQDTLFKAFARVSERMDCRLTAVGGGFNDQRIQDLIDKLKIRDKIIFTGVVTQADLPQYLDAAHILLHTARFETGCAVIQEAMASGVGVCGTRVGLLADIGDEYAVIVPPQNPEMLADEILKLVNDQQKFERITTNAFNWITENDAYWSYKNYLKLFDRIANAP